ncbi:MAG TPA: hypothetical protein VE932_06705 [Patescibacteria group bacterium]|nr:hypothetical protein [Patescibacteria group bacterium]
MAERRWVDNVEYYEYEPATIEYNPLFSAFTIARADVYSPDRRHRVILVVVVTEAEVTAERLSGEEVIGLGRAVLERLVAQQRQGIEHLATSAWHVYTITGLRIH